MTNDTYLMYQQQNIQNQRYQNKCKRLKKTIKNLVFENASLCDQVAQIQDNILCVKEERRFLFKKLIEHDSDLLNEARTNTNVVAVTTVGQDTVQPAPKKSTKKQRTNAEANNKTPKNNIGKSTKTKKHIVQTIAVDSLGRAVYPITMGHLSIHDLGEISFERPGYHTENWIYPIGFISTRIFGHIKDPQQRCVYTCKITDGGDFPRFEIIPDSDMEYAIAGPTPDLCHAALLQTINNNSDARHIDVIPQGEWFFGLGHPTVMTLIQTAPNARKCINFKSYQIDVFGMDKENDATVNYDMLQKYLAISVYHTVPEVKEEPPDELFEQSDGNSCSYSLPLE